MACDLQGARALSSPTFRDLYGAATARVSTRLTHSRRLQVKCAVFLVASLQVRYSSTLGVRPKIKFICAYPEYEYRWNGPGRLLSCDLFDWASCWRKRRSFPTLEMRKQSMSIKNATFTTALLTSNLFAVAHPPSHASGNEPHFGGCPDASMCEYVNATTHVPSITGNIYPDCDANGEVRS